MWACKHELHLQRAARRERTRVACGDSKRPASTVSGARDLLDSQRGTPEWWGALRGSASDPDSCYFRVLRPHANQRPRTQSYGLRKLARLAPCD
jgi:hypothetical protein